MLTKLRHLVAVVAGAALLACGEKAPVAGPGHVTSDSAGIRIVESRRPAWTDRVRRIDPEPVLRLGEEDEGPYQFGSLLHGALLPDDAFAVADVTSREVRVFDVSGAHRATFGGPGDGPGEFRNLAGVWAYPGDSLAATDGLGRRTTIFATTSGASVVPRVITHGVEGNHHVFGVLADGRLLLRDLGRGFRPDLPAGLQWTESDVIALDPADLSARVLARLPSREQMVLGDGNTGAVIPPRWAIQAVADDGFYWATPEGYEIRFHDGTGALRRILRRPVEPTPVESAMIREHIDRELERVRRFAGEEALPAARARLEGATFGEHVPLFSKAFVDRDQRLWVAGSMWPALAGPAGVWSVFSPEGVWLGDVEAPDGLDLLDSRDDLVLGVWRDALDVPYVQLHRLEAR